MAPLRYEPKILGPVILLGLSTGVVAQQAAVDKSKYPLPLRRRKIRRR